jgi:hypothetical protein
MTRREKAISARAASMSSPARTIFGFFGDETFRVMVADFPIAGRNTFGSTNYASGNLVLSA